MKKIIAATMQRAVLMLVCVVLILAWGAISALQMQRDYLPGINNTTLMVSLRASAMQADQVKVNVTDKVESAVRNTEGIVNVETNSYDGGLFMSLYYPMNYNMKQAEQEVKLALANVQLPDGVQKPLVTRVTTSSFPILSYSLTGKRADIDEAAVRSIAVTEVEKMLKSVPGVADVRTVGDASKGYLLTIRTKDLQKNNLTIEDLMKAIAKQIPSTTEGKIENNMLAIQANIEGLNLSDEEMNNITIRNDHGESVPLSAVADLTPALNDLKTISRTEGKPSVLVNVIKTPTSNITDVAEKVKERIAQLPSVADGNVQMTNLLDREHDLNSSLHGLVREGLLGCLFSMLFVFFFFRNVRSTLYIAISLPISLLATTAVLKAMGVTLNILTVSGMIVAMGRIVDDSIVILDNMYRRVQANKGQPVIRVLASAVNEMMPAILASTATTIAVYVPIAMVGGIVSASFSGFAWSVVIALVVSFFVAALVIPALSYMGWSSKLSDKTVTMEPLMKPVLKFAFSHKKWFVSLSALLFVASAIYAAFIPVNFLPAAHSGQVTIKVELPKGSPLPDVDAEVQKVENMLKENSNIASYSATFGSNFVPQSDDVFDEGGGFIQPPNVANMSVVVKNKDHLNPFIANLQQKLNGLSDKVVYTVTNQNISGDDSQMKIMLSGADQVTLDHAVQTIREKLANVQGLAVDGKTDMTGGVPKYEISVDREKMQQAGVSASDVWKAIGRYMGSAKDFTIASNNTQMANNMSVPIDVKTDQIRTKETAGDAPSNNPSDVLASLNAEPIKTKDGKTVRLDQIAAIKPSQLPSSIQERDGLPYSVVTGQITWNDISGVSNKVQDVLNRVSLPDNVKYSLGGISEQVKLMIMDMSVALVFSILLVLLITSSVFKGWRAPFAVLLSIPLALSGVVLAFMLFGGEWNLAALIGVLMLTGIVVTNAIVLIDKMERNRAEGMALKDAVMSGSLSRVRPIFMTAGTTVLTLLPLALTHSADTVISQTLGIVVIGGMVTSTLNSFIVIPIIYEWLQGKKARGSEQFNELQIKAV